MTKVLKVDASMRRAGSVTRDLTDRITARLEATEITQRDLAEGVEFVDEAWIGANFTDPAERSPEQRTRLVGSDVLVAEVKAADVLVIGLPIYNFGVPAAFKAWIDQIARARETFRYTENGPVGLLEGKRAIVAVASGGTTIDSEIDFTTPYIRHVLGFIGIHDVTVVDAGLQMVDAEASLASASAQIDEMNA